MQVQSVKTKQLNNKIYSSTPNNTISLNLTANAKNADEFCFADSSPKDIEFKGKYYPSGYYTDEEIRLAKKYLHIENFWDPLTDELWATYRTFDKMFHNTKTNQKMNSAVEEIKKLMQDLKNELDAEKREAKRISDELARKQAAATAARRREVELQEKIAQEKIKNEKLRTIEVKKAQIQLEKHKLNLEEKKLNEEKDLLQEQKLGNVVEVLKDKFINLIKMENDQVASKDSEKKSISFPNGIMLSGFEKENMDEIVDWLVKKSGSAIKKLDFNNHDRKSALESIREITNNTNNNRTLVQIENFAKFTTPTEENETFIAKFKAVLSSFDEKYKCTVITDIEDPSKLASEITAAHRFQVKIKNED